MLKRLFPFFTSVSSLSVAKRHFGTHQLIIKHFSSERCVPLWSRSSARKASDLLLSISAQSANCLPSPVDDIHFEREKKEDKFKHGSELLFISTRTKPDLSWQQSKPLEDYWRQYLDADHTTVVENGLILHACKFFYLHVSLPNWIHYTPSFLSVSETHFGWNSNCIFCLV